MECIRRAVPNDNNCLFTAIAYCVKGPDAVSSETAKALRKACADAALADPDPATRALLCGHDDVATYAEWVQVEHAWSGVGSSCTSARFDARPRQASSGSPPPAPRHAC